MPMRKAFVLLAVIAAPGVALAIDITFEELGPQPGAFAQTNPLRDEYLGMGVSFRGPAPLDGGAILHQSGNFGVNAHSGEHFLAFNRGATMGNGGVARDPETLNFTTAMTDVSIWAAGGFTTDTFRMEAFNAANQLVDSDNVATQSWAQLSVQGAGITRVVLTQTGDAAFVYDDLSFVPEPTSLALLAIGGLVVLRRRG